MTEERITVIGHFLVNEIPKEDETIFKADSLNNGLKPTFSLKSSKHGSETIEGVLTALERTLLKEACGLSENLQPHQHRKTTFYVDIITSDIVLSA